MKKLVIFAKCPQPGKVKTRLTPFLTPEEACQVYHKLAARTFKLADELNEGVAKEEKITVEIAYSEGSLEEIQNFAPYPFSFEPQQGNDLGEKMAYCLRHSLAEKARQVVFIGTDCPEIQKIHLKTAFDQLSESDITIGPSFDGGYYLVGFSGGFSSVLQNISWSTEKVFYETIETCKRESLSHSLLPILHDIDNQADYETLLPSYPWLKL